MVRVVEYAGGGRNRVLKYIGSAHTEADLAILYDQARNWLREYSGQGELDFGESLLVPRARTCQPREFGTMFDQAASMPRVELVSPGRVVATKSLLLAEILVCVYRDLGFDRLADEQFRDLVIAWIVRPRSLRKTGKTLKRLGLTQMSEATRRRVLRRTGVGNYQDALADLCFHHALTSGDVSLCLYDVTTVATHAEKEDELRKVGFSKSRSIDPQVVIGLLVDRRGFPLEIGVFEGNRAEKKTVLEIISQFHSRHQVEDMVVVTDAGMLSATNLEALDAEGFKFIVGARSSKAPHDLASHFHWHGDAFTDGQIIDTVTAKRGPASSDNDSGLRAEPLWEAEAMPSSWRAVWAYSRKRWVTDNRNLNRQEAKAWAVAAGEIVSRTPRFITVKGADKHVNEAALVRARVVSGLKGYVTNIPEHLMSAGEVISSYHDLWEVERSFRMFKTDLKIAPMHVFTRKSIEAHMTRAFAALAVSREIQYRTGQSIAHVIEELEDLHHATIAINGVQQTYPPQTTPEQEKLLAAIRSAMH